MLSSASAFNSTRPSACCIVSIIICQRITLSGKADLFEQNLKSRMIPQRIEGRVDPESHQAEVTVVVSLLQDSNSTVRLAKRGIDLRGADRAAELPLGLVFQGLQQT